MSSYCLSTQGFNCNSCKTELTPELQGLLLPATICRSSGVAPARPAVHPLLHVALVMLWVALLPHELGRVHARAVARHHVTTS